MTMQATATKIAATMNTELLNKVKDGFIEFANKNGINLAEMFPTRDDFATYIVSLTMKTLIDEGGYSVIEAFEMVHGEGAYSELASRIWHEVNDEAAA